LETGLFHGDIKPDNIIIREDCDEPVLLDFMIPDFQRLIAKSTSSFCHWDKNERGDYFWNQPSTFAFGTEGYMPPEQEVDGIVLPTSDVYSLGITFKRLFWPPKPSNRSNVIMKRGGSSSSKNGDNEISTLIKDMTKKEYLNRIQTMAEVRDRIENIRKKIQP
jgi:serine/threonine protein kinase